MLKYLTPKCIFLTMSQKSISAYFKKEPQGTKRKQNDHGDKALSIRDAAVYNCHSDNKLSDMLALVEDGYSCTSKTEADRINFGIKLQNALKDFTGSFLPHMKEEEEALSIRDAAVYNCHSDNKLSDMLALVEDGYSCTSKTEADRINFGIKLQNALKDFTGSFLPHMKEEEEALSIRDAAVYNCHSDNKLSDMLALVEDGYSCTSKTEADRINFGIKLQNALKDFTGSFLPHMKEEEEALSIRDAAVYNCHSDNKLSDMLALVEDGYSCTSKTEADRINFGIKLQNALKDFTGSFLPHMKEEEEVFQPMLMKYFEYEELTCFKEQVLKEHSKWQSDLEKHSFEKAEVYQKVEADEKDSECHFSSLPSEIVSHILSFLSPRDLIHCSEVCHHWYDISREPSLWKEIYPCFWAHGIWNNYDENHEDRIACFYPNSSQSNYRYYDEDADIDEYEEEGFESTEFDSAENNHGQNQRELYVLQSIVKYLLPLVGLGVQKIVISSCRSLTSSLLRSILILCPNAVHLDISYTSILDSAFKGLKEFSSCVNLQYLDMSGCKSITDLGLFRIAGTIAKLPPSISNGSEDLRDVYLEDCRCSFSGNSMDCLCDLEESGLWLQRSNACYQCRADQFFSSVCFCQKNGVMCHLAKLSLQCPFVNSYEQFQNNSSFFTPGASSTLKTTATFVSDSSKNNKSKSEICDRKCIKYLNLSGCKEITDDGLSCLLEAGVLQGLEYLDVSGCWLLTGPGLCAITDSLKYLKPENIFYCDQITNGPYPETANGCQNLESNTRACCCRMAS